MNKLVPLFVIGAGAYLLFLRSANASVNYDPEQQAYMDMITDDYQPTEDIPQVAHEPDTFIDKVVNVMSTIGSPLTRGERNNNPGNIEKGQSWQGLSADQSGDSRFAVFSAPEYGIRALGKLLQNYQRTYGINTIAGVINRWAPPTNKGIIENDTVAYINHVAQQIGVGPNDPLNLSDPAILTPLVAAIITHENGRNIYGTAAIQSGLSLLA